MKNKIHDLTFIIVLLLAAIITACQEKPPLDTVCPIGESSAEFDDDCLPSETVGQPEDAAYPVEENIIPITAEEPAYPITEADLTLLLKSWRLVSYAEDGAASDPPLKILTFNADGSYTSESETELKSGTWTTILLAIESTLILDPGTGEDQYFQIIDLGETELNLRYRRENVLIDEGFQP